MQEREPIRDAQKLVTAVRRDYPDASEILVSFPQAWELIQKWSVDDSTRCLAALPENEEPPRPDRFRGLPAEINRQLNRYRLYKLFRPWLMPSIVVGWDGATGTGRVESVWDVKVQLHPLGQAQVWHGGAYGVLWECYLDQGARSAPDWQQQLAAFWDAVETDMAAAHIFTLPHEPACEGDYPAFLRDRGYAPDPNWPPWWRRRA